MTNTQSKHMLARVIMDAVAAGSKLSNSDQTALAREMALAKERASIDPWKVQNGGYRSNS